jgi:macrolide transport system ATP-binding/permease protein
MRWRREFSKIQRLFRPYKCANDVEEEIRFHLKMEERENLESGMSQKEAHYAAMRRFGNVTIAKEKSREMWRWNFAETVFQDIRFGFRQLRRSPGFSILAILCLTLGIGANAAVFSWIEGILFRPYPAVTHQEQLLALTGTARGESEHTGISWPDLVDLQRSCTLCDAFIVSKIMGTTLSVGERAEITTGSIVSANYLMRSGSIPFWAADSSRARTRGAAPIPSP